MSYPLTIADTTLTIETGRVEGDVEQKIEQYMRGERVVFDEPVDLSDFTEFQQRVLGAIRSIPYGETVTYAALAEMAGTSTDPPVRAAANACGANPVPVVIPCHRVVAKNGMGGYRYGRDVKQALLDLEQGTTESFINSSE